MKVENMTSNNGNKIANQFIIYDNDCTYFQSYDSIIIQKIENECFIYLDEKYWNYSKTTSKYRNKFLNMTTKEIENAIKDNTILLINLN
tara:strand:+ start:835 stop:1101 length:267 start_codon:yes stop_codon:yes gene_type:complete